MTNAKNATAAGVRRASATPAVPRPPKARPVVFKLHAPDAQRVTVAGDFNGWNRTAHHLKRDKQGVWKLTLRLIPGSYQYQFVLDDESWREDPENPMRVPNEHGTQNSVCHVS